MRKVPCSLAVMFTLLAGGLWPALATASPRVSTAPIDPLSTQFHINHEDPEASVPPMEQRNAKPLEFGYYLQDLIAFAMAADKAGDHLAAARYYRAFAKAVPDESVAFSKLCESLEAAGEREKAAAACRDALGRPGIEVKDYLHFVNLVLAKPGPLTKDEEEDLDEVVDHFRKNPETRIAGIHVQCELALHQANVPLLQQCSGELAAFAPNDPKTISFQWAAAMRQGNAAEARRLVDRARVAGMKPEGLQRMEQATDALPTGKLRRAVMAGLALAVVGAAAALLAWRRRGPRQRLA